MANDYVLAKSRKEALSFIYDNNLDLKTKLILEEKPKLNIERGAKSEAKLIYYKANSVSINTKSTGNSLLFLSDNFYEDWKVKIDGKKDKVIIADYTFRSVAVPKGNHKIEFYYESEKFKKGIMVSVLGIGLLVISLYYVKKNKKI
jgi:uncharacterized membrane protein YfhO